MKRHYLALIISVIFITSVLITSCKNASITIEASSDNKNEFMLGSILWIQTSAEARAMYYQSFNLAAMRLDKSLKEYRGLKKPAVVLDIDETVLDNSPYDVRIYRENKLYPEFWKEWIESTAAKPVPGVSEFLAAAKSLGADIFYITNRKEEFRDATLKNLSAAGLPNADDKHLLMRTKENNKQSRRISVAEEHEILLLIGDNLGDFDDVFQGKSVVERAAAVDSLRDLFGKRFIVLPNPMYGDWLDAIYDYEYSKSEKKKAELRKKYLTDF
ncbi:5'-nucleotidase, lipoprotein e(P4) family [candidate division KSB1 bacterium]|nr:5'-nucleotidase, lipoprotein e(P4) family [candidate division KSB1 bacterium]